MKVYIAIGSNIEPRLWYVRAAIASLGAVVDDLDCSSIYETEPEIVVDQPLFLNAVVAGDSALSPHRLLDGLQAIESRFGRRRGSEQPKGPRTLDLDLLLVDSAVLSSERLEVPHPGISERDFVLVPLIEVDPEVKDPRSGRAYSSVLADRRQAGVYRAPRKLYTARTS